MDLKWELPLSRDGIETHLGDGTPVRVRPIRATDDAELAAAFARMSPRSRYLRFFTLRDELGAAMLDAFTNIDHREHRAWVMIDPAEPSDAGSDEGLGIAVARLICLADDPGVAEATLAVTDDYQRRGVGRLLLDLLVSTAVIAGVDKLRFETLWENRGMRRLLSDLGAESNAALSDGGVLVYDVAIDGDDDGTVGAVYAILRWIAQS